MCPWSKPRRGGRRKAPAKRKREAEGYRVQVRRVWGDNYRVNVLVGPDVVSFAIAHSFFLTADGDGKILSSCPTMARAY